MAKKQKKCEKQSGKGIKRHADGADPPIINNEEKQQMEDDGKQVEVKALKGPGENSKNSTKAAFPTPIDSNTGTITSTESAKKRSVRGVSAMHKVAMKKAQGKKFKIRYNRSGVPIGDTRRILQSYVGMLARTMTPIDIPSWPKVDDDLKEKIWSDVQATFEVEPESENFVLMSAGTKWRQFKSMLTRDYVMPFIGQKKKLAKPPRKYAFVGKEAWKRFVAIRSNDDWKTINKEQSERVGQRKHPHRTSRKGYVGVQEEEEAAGRMDPEEDPDRAILWKISRMKDNENADEELAEIYGRIDDLLEKKRTGDFVPSGMSDVLSTALQTPEHSGRVRGVGSFISPSKYFNMPRKRKNQSSKAEKETKDELEKTKAELERTKNEFSTQINELKAMMASFQSPNASDKASCRVELDELMANNEDDDIFIAPDPVRPPSPPGNKGPRKCALAVDNIDNKVAFGRVVPEAGDAGKSVHGVPLQPGHVRVSVDGVIKGDALVPVPVVGEIETVCQAVGSYLAWPRDMISFNPTQAKKRKNEVQSTKKPKNELDRLHDMFANVNPDKKVPHRFRLLYKHAITFMKERGDSIQIGCDENVFGMAKTLYVLHENVIDLLKFGMIGGAVISTYMAYLSTVVAARNLDMFAFADPGASFKLNDDFEAYIVNRLMAAPSRILFLPHNEHYHWILILIWESEIFVLNPLHSNKFDVLEAALVRAVRSYNAQTGRVNKNPKVKNLLGSPKQPGGTECGYVVMRYMKDIIEDKEMEFMTKWASKNRKSIYTEEDLDVVRCEALDYIQGFV